MASVTALPPRGGGPPIDPTRIRWLRQQAFVMIAQLPEDPQDALAILRYAERLICLAEEITPV